MKKFLEEDQAKIMRERKSKGKRKTQGRSTDVSDLKKLSYSFYNQETISGNKKIMLDLFPTQFV